jgi:hypothetical protein
MLLSPIWQGSATVSKVILGLKARSDMEVHKRPTVRAACRCVFEVLLNQLSQCFVVHNLRLPDRKVTSSGSYLFLSALGTRVDIPLFSRPPLGYLFFPCDAFYNFVTNALFSLSFAKTFSLFFA